MRKPNKSSRKDYFLSGIIKYFIIKIFNSLDPLKGPLAEKGYLKSKIKNVPSFNSDNEIISTKEIVEYVFQNTKVLNHIKKYIFQPRLDLVRIIQSPLVKENDQTLWHHDSCGHRIKLYIGLDSYLKKDIYTELVPCTNRNSYFDYNFTRIILTSEEKKIPTKKILLKKGDIFLFDTNMIHRGNYSNDVSRKLIEVEFSSAIRGFILPGKIGRKKNKRENNLLDLVEIKYCF